MHDEPRRYFMLIQLAAGSDKARRIDAFTKLKAVIEDATYEKDYVPIYHGSDGAAMGFLIRTKREAWELSTAIDSPGGKNRGSIGPGRPQPIKDVLRRGDSILVFEVGETFHERGFGRAKAWLQHR